MSRSSLMNLAMSVALALLAAATPSSAATHGSRETARTPRLLTTREVYELEHRARVRVFTAPGVLAADGVYLGVADDPDSAYARRFESARAALEAQGLPALGDPVRIAWHSIEGAAETRNATFAGFDYRGVRFREGTRRVQRIEFSKVDTLSCEHGRTAGADLAALAAAHGLPASTVLVVHQKSRDADGRRRDEFVRIPWEEARSVERGPSDSSPTGGAIAGAVLGVLVGALVGMWAVASALGHS